MTEKSQSAFVSVESDNRASFPGGVHSEPENQDQIPTEGQFDSTQPNSFQPTSADLLPGPEPEYLVLEWFADSRYVRPRTRQYYSSMLVLVILFSLLLFVANQMVLIVLLLAFFFITVVLARVKPETVHVQITTYGVRYQEQLIFWDEISQFWIRNIHGFEQVHLEVPEKIFRQLVILPSNAMSPVQVSIEDIAELVGRVVPYQEPLPNRFDMWVQWLEQKFPLESQPIPAKPSTEPTMQKSSQTQSISQPPGPEAQNK